MNHPQLCVMARAPEPGRTKTRLIPSLGPEGAARLSWAMTMDVLELAAAVAFHREFTLKVLVAGNLEHPAIQALSYPKEAQKEGDLGVRLMGAMQPRQPTIFIGTDAPTLPEHLMMDAIDELLRGQVPFVPAFDGGYALVGTWNPEIFRDIPWSCAQTLQASVARVRALGQSETLLSFWYDIDEPTDLVFLRNHLAILPENIAPHTRAFMAQMG